MVTTGGDDGKRFCWEHWQGDYWGSFEEVLGVQNGWDYVIEFQENQRNSSETKTGKGQALFINYVTQNYKKKRST